MDKAALKEILKSELGYNAHEADLTAEDLCNLRPQLKDALKLWYELRIETDVTIDGFSAKSLMEKKCFTYPAALVALDWLLTDPSTANAVLSSDIRK